MAQLVTKAPPGMHFEPAASFSETAIEPTVLPRKEARRIESASPIRGYSHGAWGAIRDCPQSYGRRIKERLATNRHHSALSCLSARALEEFRVVGDVVDPKLTHNSLYVVCVEATPIRKGTTKLAQPHYS